MDNLAKILDNLNKISDQEEKTFKLKVQEFKEMFGIDYLEFREPTFEEFDYLSSKENEQEEYIISTLCVEPNFNDEKLQKALKVKTGNEVVRKLLKEHRIKLLAMSIIEESGFTGKGIEVIKN